MRTISTLLFYAVLSAVGFGQEPTVELPRFGPLPIPKDWEVIDQGSHGDANNPSHWIVLQKKDKVEFLSFSAFGPPGSQITNAIYFADTAHEIFPDGRIASGIKARPPHTPSSSSWNLRHGLVALDGYQVLEYSFVADFEGKSDNLQAHGYLLFGDFVMIVQHTSNRPITPELAQGVAVRTMRTLSKISAPENLIAK